MDERFLALFVGAALGFVLGYIVRDLREIKEKVDHVDKRVSEFHPDDGVVTTGLLTRIGLFLVVGMTAYAAIISQIAANRSNDNADNQKKIVECSSLYLSKTINAANARTQYSIEQAQANVTLQVAQKRLLTIAFRKPPPTTAESIHAGLVYYDALNRFVEISKKTTSTIQDNPYPSSRALSDCISGVKPKPKK